jgi:ricin-type beta-trefoil lectin protein
MFVASLFLTTGVFGQTTVPTGLVNVISQSDALCLGVRGGPGATQQTAAIEQESCVAAGESSQQFTFIPVNGGYKIIANNSGLALQPAAGYSSVERTIIEQWPYGGQSYQVWVVSPVPNQAGYFLIRPSNATYYCMDVSQMSTTPGAVIWLSYCDGNSNQNWQFVPAAATPSLNHSVTLTWNASTSPTASGYKVYRGTAAGGPYSLISSVTGLTYTDESVTPGATYFYVTATTDSNGALSAYSNEVRATVPTQ